MKHRCACRQLQLEKIVFCIIFAAACLVGVVSPAISATITLMPWNNLQNAVKANPAGTTFLLRPGIYRQASITAIKNGDRFLGQPGAILDGAKQLSGWTIVSIHGASYWTTAGGTPLSSPRCGARQCCLPDYPGCAYVQNLYVDNVNYHHVVSLDNVTPGTWYYDFDGNDGGTRNNIYMALSDRPNSRNVELSDQNHAFAGSAANVTIKDLVIEKYAAPIQMAAVQPQGPNWLIESNEVRLNHGFGIKALPGGDNVRVLGNNVHHNGQMGIGTGRVSGGLWDGNKVSYNNIDGVNPGFEAGGSKFVGNNITISNNVVHDNYGVGLWTDAGASYNTYDHNICYDNVGGIYYEISRYGVIKNNTVYGNTKFAQIVYTGSDHGRITGNTVVDNGTGAIYIQNIVGTRPGTTIYPLTDTQVTNNTIVILKPKSVAAGLRDFARPSEPGVFTDPTNLFEGNVYKFSGQPQFSGLLRFASNRPSGPFWYWGENGARGSQRVDWRNWQTSGHDRQGRLVRSSAGG